MTTPEVKTTEVVDPCRVMFRECRLAFPSLFVKKPRAKPTASQPNPEQTYQTVLLIPPTFDFTEVKAAMNAAMIKKFDKVIELTGKNSQPITPCRGEWAGFVKGWFRVSMHNPARKPPVIGPSKLPITDPAEIWAGQWVNVIANCYGWGPNAGGRGLSFDLAAVQLIRPGADTDPDGARLDGRGRPVDPDAAFQALEMPAEGGADDFDPLAGLPGMGKK